jgi:hypothetical protein
LEHWRINTTDFDAGARCAHVFLRFPVHNATITRTWLVGQHGRHKASFQLEAPNPFKLPSSMYPLRLFVSLLMHQLRRHQLLSVRRGAAQVSCLYLNAMIDPVRDASEVERTVEEASGLRTVLSPQRTEPGSDVAINMLQRINAERAPLLITEVGTHWSDLILAKRAAASRPSLVLRWWNESTLDTTLLPSSGIEPGCSHFHRGLCASAGAIPEMQSQMGVCANRAKYRCDMSPRNTPAGQLMWYRPLTAPHATVTTPHSLPPRAGNTSRRTLANSTTSAHTSHHKHTR